MRASTQRNLLATLAFSQGVPMLLARRRDAATRSTATTTPTARTPSSRWIDWNLDETRARSPRLHAPGVRASAPATRCCGGAASSTGASSPAPASRTSRGSAPTVSELTELDWHDPNTHVLGMLIHGQATDEKDDHGRPVDRPHAALAGERRRPSARVHVAAARAARANGTS